jgi:hypothetical protein
VLKYLSTTPWKNTRECRCSAIIYYLGTRLRWGFSVTPRPLFPGTHWVRGWLGPRAGLDAMEKKKIFPLPGIGPRPPNPCTGLYTDWDIPAFDLLWICARKYKCIFYFSRNVKSLFRLAFAEVDVCSMGFVQHCSWMRHIAELCSVRELTVQ